jgi:hypothetical protein
LKFVWDLGLGISGDRVLLRMQAGIAPIPGFPHRVLRYIGFRRVFTACHQIVEETDICRGVVLDRDFDPETHPNPNRIRNPNRPAAGIDYDWDEDCD